MAAKAPGIEAYIRSEKVFAVNGRRPPAEQVEAEVAGKMLPGWTVAQNGFCLLTDQPMPLKEAAFEETPGRFSAPTLFRFCGSEAVAVPADPAGPAAAEAPSTFTAYSKHIAEAAKVAFPEAEYVYVGGHISFSAEVSPMSQIKVLLSMTVARALAKLLSKVLPCCCAPPKDEVARRALVPTFGAAQFVHVDRSAEEGAEFYARRISAGARGGAVGEAERLRLPHAFVSDTSRRRRLFVANFWRNQRADASIKTDHLAVLDGQTVTEAELHAAKFTNVFIGGTQQYHLNVKEGHRLVYFPDMAQDELLVFKQGAYDVERGAEEGQYSVTPAPEPQRHFIFHSSIRDPTAPKDDPPRKAVVCAAVLVIMPEVQK